MKNVWSVVFGIIGGLLAVGGGAFKNAYETGYSYVVTAAEERAAIRNAETCMFIGIGICIIVFLIYLKGAIKKR